jgi:hypothetical protein
MLLWVIFILYQQISIEIGFHLNRGRGCPCLVAPARARHDDDQNNSARAEGDPCHAPPTAATIVAELPLLGSLFVGIDSIAGVDPPPGKSGISTGRAVSKRVDGTEEGRKRCEQQSAEGKKRSEMRIAAVSGTAETANGVDSVAASVAAGVPDCCV